MSAYCNPEAIAAVSSGVRVWGCERTARHVAQTMMADDWAGLNTTEESLQAQWSVWMDYAMATGSPILHSFPDRNECNI